MTSEQQDEAAYEERGQYYEAGSNGKLVGINAPCHGCRGPEGGAEGDFGRRLVNMRP